VTLSKYTGDFFPYTQYKEDPPFYDHYWGGYFTSRPALKKRIRDSLTRERNLNAFFSLLNFSRNKLSGFDDAFSTLKQARKMNSVMLHHDAITGTQGSSVNQDYNRILNDISNFMDTSLSRLSLTQTSPGVSYELILFNPSIYVRDEVMDIVVKSQYIKA
jgi:hypothetical protein